MNSSIRSLQFARAVLAVSAWAILGLVVVGLILSVPAIAERADAGNTVLRGVGIAARALMIPAAIGTWAGALWYCWVDRPGPAAPRWLMVSTLVMLHFAGGFFYYFLYVHWSDGTSPGHGSPRPFPGRHPRP